MTTQHDLTELRELASLADVPPPRRTDAAFARSVHDGVRRRRSRALLALPALAGACAAFAFVLFRAGPSTIDEPAGAGVVATADADLFDEAALFALPELEGSSDQELALLDEELDRRLAQRGTP